MKAKREAFESATWNARGRDGLGPENPQAQSDCKTCKGHGVVDEGGFTGAIYGNCPDCWMSPRASSEGRETK